MIRKVDDQQQRDREIDLEGLRTQVANQAASLAETVTDGFEGFHMGAGDYVVELMAPGGQSTAGGAHARQAIRLVPRRRGYAVVVVGSVDPVTSTAEIRTFEHIAVLHEIRFRQPLEINGEEYADFLRKLDVVLNLARVRGTRVGPSPELMERARIARKGTRTSLAAIVVFVVVLVLAAIVAFRVMRILAH